MLRPEQLLIWEETVNVNETYPVPVEETEPAKNTKIISEFDQIG